MTKTSDPASWERYHDCELTLLGLHEIIDFSSGACQEGPVPAWRMSVASGA